MRARRFVKLIGALALCCSLPMVAAAQASRPAPASTVEPENFAALSCVEFIEASRIAVPPKKATAAQRRRAESAQDAISAAMLWMHGYLTGRNAPNLGKVSKEWLEATVGRLAKECRAAPDPAKLLIVDVVAKL